MTTITKEKKQELVFKIASLPKYIPNKSRLQDDWKKMFTEFQNMLQGLNFEFSGLFNLKNIPEWQVNLEGFTLVIEKTASYLILKSRDISLRLEFDVTYTEKHLRKKFTKFFTELKKEKEKEAQDQLDFNEACTFIQDLVLKLNVLPEFRNVIFKKFNTNEKINVTLHLDKRTLFGFTYFIKTKSFSFYLPENKTFNNLNNESLLELENFVMEYKNYLKFIEIIKDLIPNA